MTIRKQIISMLLVGALLCPACSLDSVKAADEVKITISAAGDCTLGSDDRYNTNFYTYYNNNTPEYFLSGVKDVFENDDITIVNLEGTFTTATSRQDKTFTFKAPSNYSKILKKGDVEVVNIANNHTYDYGSAGYEDTVATLEKKKIKYCGGSSIAYETVEGVKIAFVGFNALSGANADTVRKTIKEAKDNDAVIVIASFHWGIEREYYPNSSQKTLAHTAIDSGANLVLGHHPHVLQGIEKYKGRYIAYSLGNFCFGGNSNPADKDTMILQQTFTVRNGKCKKTDEVSVIPCSLSSVTYTNDFKPTILTDSARETVRKKINKLSEGFGIKVGLKGRVKENQ